LKGLKGQEAHVSAFWRYSTFSVWRAGSLGQLVFESLVWSGFLMLRGLNHNFNQSAFSQKPKKPDWTAKDHRPRFFVVFRLVSVFTGFNWFITGL